MPNYVTNQTISSIDINVTCTTVADSAPRESAVVESTATFYVLLICFFCCTLSNLLTIISTRLPSMKTVRLVHLYELVAVTDLVAGFELLILGVALSLSRQNKSTSQAVQADRHSDDSSSVLVTVIRCLIVIVFNTTWDMVTIYAVFINLCRTMAASVSPSRYLTAVNEYFLHAAYGNMLIALVIEIMLMMPFVQVKLAPFNRGTLHRIGCCKSPRYKCLAWNILLGIRFILYCVLPVVIYAGSLTIFFFNIQSKQASATRRRKRLKLFGDRVFTCTVHSVCAIFVHVEAAFYSNSCERPLLESRHALDSSGIPFTGQCLPMNTIALTDFQIGILMVEAIFRVTFAPIFVFVPAGTRAKLTLIIFGKNRQSRVSSIA